MGYILNFTVILDDIFRTTGGNVTENAVLEVMGTHVRSGRRDSIHQDIRSFVIETFSIRFAVPEKDLVLEKIIHLIRQYCAPAQY
jgi:S-ribosylhomocysteine lyase LuxS involved in autoinducer biosynthesis